MPTPTFEDRLATLQASMQDDIDKAAAHVAHHRVSDLVDDHGHQYVDVVMEGGGVLGIALLGYLHVLEQAGIRFLNIAGASAGAVTAAGLAAAGRPGEERVRKLFGILPQMDMWSFVDGKDDDDRDAKPFVESITRGSRGWLAQRKFMGVALGTLWTGLQVRDNIGAIWALNRGDAFLAWTKKDLLERFGVRDVAALRQRMAPEPGSLRVHADRVFSEPSELHPHPVVADSAPLFDPLRHRLALIAADITTQQRAVLPRDAHLYWGDDDAALHPAELVRASMSIPLFFAPHRVPLHRAGKAAAHWHGKYPSDGLYAEFKRATHAFMVDGGLMSNFPIDVFHAADHVPLCPTFGIKLELDKAVHDVDDAAGVLMGAFNTARHSLDNEFIRANPDFRHLVRCIDTGDHHWLDFNLDDAAKIDLVRRGMEAGLGFLRTGSRDGPAFQWETYKEVRRQLAKARSLLP